WTVEDPRAGFIDRFGFFTAGDGVGDYPDAIGVLGVQTTPQGEIVRENFVSVTIGEGAPPGVVRNVELIPNSVYLEPEDVVVFSVHAFDGNSQPVRDVVFSWSVQDPQAGSIDSAGRLRAGSGVGYYPEAVRVVAIQTSAEGEVRVEDIAHVTVVEPETLGILSSGYVLPSSVALNPGQRFIFTAAAFDQNGEGIGGVSRAWDVLDPRVGSMDEYGVLTAGDVTGVFPDAVRLELVQGEGPDRRVVVSYASVGIVGELQKAAIQPARVVLRPGQSVLFQAKGYDANDLLVSPLRGVWSVEDPEAGTIDQAGLFTAGDTPGEYVNAVKAVVSER
ncbi:MAG: hypothetical protein ACE5JL_08155, partial [Dehalococcoidia bacterium]